MTPTTIRSLAAAAATAAALATIVAAAPPAHAALLQNGDFEAGPMLSLPDGWFYSFATLGGPQNASNLFVTDGAAYTACCGTTGTDAAKANRFATFGAGDSPNGPSLLGQAFATTAGQSYSVVFDLAAFGVAGTQAMHLRLDDLTNNSHITHADYLAISATDLDTGFVTYSLTFVATGALTLLSFQNGDAITNDIDAVIDNVGVTAAAVPEPAAWALMLVGFTGLGAALRSRRTAVARAGAHTLV